MKRFKFLIKASLCLLGALPLGSPAASNGNFYPRVGGVPYVILNVETNTFLHYDGSEWFTSETPDKFSGTNDVWYFSESDNADGTTGYKIYFIGSDGTTNNYITSSAKGGYANGISSNEADAQDWYILRNDYNREGYAVSDDPYFTKNVWYTYWDNNINYKKYYNSYSNSPVDDDKHGATKYYLLSTYKFFTYGDLYTEAKSKLTDGYLLPDSASNPTGDDFKELIGIISAYNTANGNLRYTANINGQSDDNGIYVIKSRRYNTYLARRHDGSIYMSNFINSDCIWSVSHDTANGIYQMGTESSLSNPDDAQKYLYMNAGTPVTAQNTHLSLYTTGDAENKYYQICDSAGANCLVANYERTTSEVSRSDYHETRSNDYYIKDANWKFTPLDPSNRTNDHVGATESELSADNTGFYRIENNGYQLGGSKSGGWIADVDHRDMRHYDYYLATNKSNTKPYYKDMPMVDIVSTSRVKTTASNLWQLQVVVKKNASSDDDYPIGVTNVHTHNIYVIKNVNSGKYICCPNSDDFFSLAKNSDGSMPDSVAKFWFEPEAQYPGEYYMAYREPRKVADVVKGYVIIRNSGYELGGNDITPFVAGLYLSKNTETSQFKSDDDKKAALWDFQKARTIDAITGYTQVTSDGKADPTGPRYVSVYFPFHVTPASKDVKLYIAKKNDAQSVKLTRVSDVPANTGVLVWQDPTGSSDDNIQTVSFNIQPTTESDADVKDNILRGVTESEDLWFNCPGSTSMKDNYYIFTSTLDDNGTTKESNLVLAHPLDEYPMANRCYILTSDVAAESSSAKENLQLIFDDSEVTGIKDITPADHSSSNFYYDLMGRRVDNPSKGIYIYRGRKIIIR